MKAKLNIIICTFLFTALMSCSTERYASAQSEDGYHSQNNNYYDNGYNSYDQYASDVNLNMFVNQLSPYGRWMNSSSYGQVWLCNDRGFIPYYSNGHWVYSTYGWTWASNYNWGWGPFHYGRWAHDPFYGWMWVPGYQWGPAWVGWRTGGDYYGWAPLAPGININVGSSFGSYMPADRWCFVPRNNITSPDISRYRVNKERNTTIINNTTVINNTNVYNNTRYMSGPTRTEVQRQTGQRINVLRVSNDSKPGQTRVLNNNTIKIYRPQITKVNNEYNQSNQNAQNDRQVQPNQRLNDRNIQQYPGTSPRDDNNNVEEINNTRSNNVEQRRVEPPARRNVTPQRVPNVRRSDNNQRTNTPPQNTRTFNRNQEVDRSSQSQPVQQPSNVERSRPAPGNAIPSKRPHE